MVEEQIYISAMQHLHCLYFFIACCVVAIPYSEKKIITLLWQR